MSFTIDQVRAQLNVDEPDYNEIAQLGVEAIPFLKQLVLDTDTMLASKAVYLASLIESDQSTTVVAAAMSSPYPTVRVAAASAARNLPADVSIRLFDSLLDDQDVGVRKVALKSISVSGVLGDRATTAPGIGLRTESAAEVSNLKAKVQQLANGDQHEFIRDLANKTLN